MWSRSSSLNGERRSTHSISFLRIRFKGVKSVREPSLHRFGMLQAKPDISCASGAHEKSWESASLRISG